MPDSIGYSSRLCHYLNPRFWFGLLAILLAIFNVVVGHMEEAASIFGWPNYYMPFLVRAGHLKPLGKPAQNARKWFATVEIERMSCDPGWLDKAIRIVEKQIQEMNKKQKGKEPEVCAVS
jgi:hypothetical protein